MSHISATLPESLSHDSLSTPFFKNQIGGLLRKTHGIFRFTTSTIPFILFRFRILASIVVGRIKARAPQGPRYPFLHHGRWAIITADYGTAVMAKAAVLRAVPNFRKVICLTVRLGLEPKSFVEHRTLNHCPLPLFPILRVGGLRFPFRHLIRTNRFAVGFPAKKKSRFSAALRLRNPGCPEHHR